MEYLESPEISVIQYVNTLTYENVAGVAKEHGIEVTDNMTKGEIALKIIDFVFHKI